MMKRLLDFFVALLVFIILSPLLFLVAAAVKLTSKGPAIYWSRRVGIDNKIFLMPKFRTMQVETPQVATHLLSNPDQFLTPIGSFLRKTSLDELPQIWSILTGDMSLVGPRPALFNQDDLIELRTQKGVHKMTPGITGWAQVNGRDNISIAEKVILDTEYLLQQSFWFDLKIIFLTARNVIFGRDISH